MWPSTEALNTQDRSGLRLNAVRNRAVEIVQLPFPGVGILGLLGRNRFRGTKEAKALRHF